MSLSQFSGCASVNESNISLPKRINTGTKESKRCAQLPELQKYIETIIKASNEYDSEDASISERDRFPKDRKFGKYSVYKGLDGKTKQGKIKNQLNMSRSKSNTKAKTQVSEAVSRGVKIYNMFAPEFEDPRNWKLSKTQNLGPSVEIEEFLKKFYPNPYHIETVNKFENSKDDTLRDGTLPDVVISKTNIHIGVDIERTDTNDLASADIEGTKPCKRGKKDLNITPGTSVEKYTQSPPCYDNITEDTITGDVSAPSFLALTKTYSEIKSSNSTSNTSSSHASLTEMIHKDSQTNLKKKKSVTSKSRLKALKRNRYSDYDIGKLKLLSLTDSENSLTKPQLEKTIINDATGSDEIVCEKSSKLCEEICESEDLREMTEIYDIMYKATESFLYISSKNDSEIFLKNLMESRVFSNELKQENANIRKSKNDIQLRKSDERGNKIYRTMGQIVSDKDLNPVEKSKMGETNTIGRSLINILLKEDNFKYRSHQEPECDKSLSNYDAGGPSEASSGSDFRQKKEEKQNVSDKNQEADEVLDFMYGCMKKLCNKERSSSEEDGNQPQEMKKVVEKTISCRNFRKRSMTEINYEKPTSNSSKSTDFWAYQRESTENLLAKNFPDIKEIESKYSAALDEINKKQLSITRYRRKPPQGFTRKLSDKKWEEFSPTNQNPGISATPPVRNANDLPCLQSNETVNENGRISAVLTVEGQNELGGYAEETYEPPSSTNEDTRITKPVFPLSIKRKKRTGKTLKDVLEAEEKLLSDEPKGREIETKEKRNEKYLISSTTAEQAVVQNNSTKVYSHLGDFTRPNSNFIICVNSFPRNLRSATSTRPTLPLPLSVSLGDMRASFNKRQLYPTFTLKKLSLSPQTGCCVLEHTYNFKQELLLTINKTLVAYIALPVCLKVNTNNSKLVQEFSLKSSECLIEIIIKVQRCEGAENAESTPAFEFTQSPVEDDKPVKDLIEAIEEAEEKAFVLERCADPGENPYLKNSQMCGLSAREIMKNEFLDNEVDNENDRKKIHELLLRTCNLQQKLQSYLHKMSCAQVISLSCPLVYQEGVTRNDVEAEFARKPECSFPVVRWHLNPPETEVKLKSDESVTVSVVMIDRETSYDPPADEGRCEKVVGPEYELNSTEDTEQLPEDRGNDEVDRSSKYSFRSSNDFSESRETPEAKKDSKGSEHNTNKKFFKKIFNELELFKQTVEANKLKKQLQSNSNLKEAEELGVDRRLTQYDPKTPAKVLRTVFKGRKSLTELTIGLKHVPITKVGSISVEKTKFSPNHTKISICITRETSEEPPNNLSSYFFDHMRPCLSTCLTEYSTPREDDSKSSQSLNNESDDDEDDYKSVRSTWDNSDSDAGEEVKSEAKDPKTDQPFPPNNFIKHRFDFYPKMNMELDLNKSKQKSPTNSVCRYKELEPLNQALTDMQIRMRSIKRDAKSNDFYERALKLAKMSAGFCQNCGNRAVIPNDTFGYYKTLVPRRYTHHRRNRNIRTTITPNSSFYSLRSSSAEISDHSCDLGIKHGSFIFKPRIHPNRTVFRNSLHNMPVLFERM